MTTQILLVTGMSGAGRTTALKALEDCDFEAVDNLPASLLGNLVRSSDRPERNLAVGIDSRTRDFDPPNLGAQIANRRRRPNPNLRLLFLDCEDEFLRRRFTETRRPHPLAPDRPVTDGIARERLLMAPLREIADLVLDTSQLTPGDLRRLVTGYFDQSHADHLTISVVSFAFRHGVPREADLVFDVRFLANPHYVDELRPKSGRDPDVRAYVEEDPAYGILVERLEALLTPLLPRYQREGRSYLTIAFGCTGGRHRSIVTAEEFGRRLRTAGWRVLVRHRDTPHANTDLDVDDGTRDDGRLEQDGDGDDRRQPLE